MVCEKSTRVSPKSSALSTPILTSTDWKAVEYVPGPIDDIFEDTLGGSISLSLYMKGDDHLVDVDSNYGPELIAEDYAFDRNYVLSEETKSLDEKVSDFNPNYNENEPPLKHVPAFVPVTSKIETESKQTKNSQDINVIANQKIKHQCTDRDVLFGRGGARNHHAGNRRYRELVNSNKNTYRQSTCKDEKTKIAKSIVDSVNRYGGRFLMQDPITGDWIEVEKRKARQKVSQALRD